MKLKPLALTVAALVILSGIVFWTNRPAPPRGADPRIGQSIAQPSTLGSIKKIKVSSDDKSVSLSRLPDISWVVDDYYQLPADFTKITRLVSDVVDTKIQRFVTANNERFARLEFKKPSIEFFTGETQPILSLTLGKNAEGGGRFLRFNNETKAYLVKTSLYLDADPKSWANPEMLTLKAEDVAKAEITFASGDKLIVHRVKKEDPFTADNVPTGKKFNAEQITSVINQFSSVRFSNTAESSAPDVTAAKDHARTFTFDLFDGTHYSIALGRRPAPSVPPSVEKPTTTASSAVAIADAKPSDSSPSPTETTPTATASSAAATPPPPPPPGPVYVFIESSKTTAPINALMKKRGFEVPEYTLTSLPEKPDSFFTPAEEKK